MGDSPAKNPFQYAQQFVQGRDAEQRTKQLRQISSGGDVLAPEYLDPQHSQAFKAFKRHGIRPEYDYPELPNAYRGDYTGAEVHATDEVVQRKSGVRFGGQLAKPFTDDILQQGLALAQLDEAAVRAQGKTRDPRALPAGLEDPDKATEALPGLYERLPENLRQLARPSALDRSIMREQRELAEARNAIEAKGLAVKEGTAKPGDFEVTLRLDGTREDISSKYRGKAPSGPSAPLPDSEPGFLSGLASEILDFSGENEYFGGPKDQDQALSNIQTQTNFQGHDEVTTALLKSPFSGYTPDKEYTIDQIILPIGQTSDGKYGVEVLSVRNKVFGNLMARETERTGQRPENGGARFYELANEAQSVVDKWVNAQKDVPLIDRRSRKDRARQIIRGEDWTSYLITPVTGAALWAAESIGATDAIGNVVGIDDLSGKINTAYYGVTAPARAMLSSLVTFAPEAVGGESLETYRYGQSVENIGQNPFSWLLNLGTFGPIISSAHNLTLTDSVYDSFEKSLLASTEEVLSGKASAFDYMSDLSNPLGKSWSDWEQKDWTNLIMTPAPIIATAIAQAGLSGIESATGQEGKIYFFDWVPFLGELPDMRMSQLLNVIPPMGTSLAEVDAISLMTFGTGKVVKAASPVIRAAYVSQSIDALDALKSPKALEFLRGDNVDFLPELQRTNAGLHKIVVTQLAQALETRGGWAVPDDAAISPSIPGYMQDLVGHLKEAEKQGANLEELAKNVNDAVLDIKKVLDAFSEEEVSYGLLKDYVTRMPGGDKILRQAEKLAKTTDITDLPDELRVVVDADNKPITMNGRRVLQGEHGQIVATQRINQALTRTTRPADPSVAYNPDQLLFRGPDLVNQNNIRISHFDFDETFDVASQEWDTLSRSAIAGTEQLVGEFTVAANKTTRTVDTPQIPLGKPPRGPKYPPLEKFIANEVASFDADKKRALREAALAGEEAFAPVVASMISAIKSARKKGRDLSARKAWVAYALKKELGRAEEIVSETLVASRAGDFDLKKLLSQIKKGDHDDRLRSLWIAEIEQLRKADFFNKVDDPWENLPASTVAIRNLLKERAEKLRVRFDADVGEINRLAAFTQDQNLAMALAVAQRRIAMSKRQAIPGLKLALQKIAENGWDDFIGKGIEAGVPKAVRKAIKAIDKKGDAEKAWKLITKLIEQGKLDKFTVEGLEAGARMQAKAKASRDLESIWVKTIDGIQSDLVRGREFIRRGDMPEEPPLEVPWRSSALRTFTSTNDKGELVLDVKGYNAAIAERYGVAELPDAWLTNKWSDVYRVRASASATEVIDASLRSRLMAFENHLQFEKRSRFVRKNQVRATAALMQSLNDPTLPVSMNFWRDPRALYATIRGLVAKIKSRVDPNIARFGITSRVVASVGRVSRETVWRFMDEISAIQRYALAENLDATQLLKEYMTTTKSMRLGREDQFYAQRTIMNRQIPPWQKFRRIVREPPKNMIGQAAEEAEKNLITSNTFLNSLARMWLRADDPAETSVKAIVEDLKIALGRTGTPKDYEELFKRLGQPKIADVLEDYDTFIKFTYDVAQYHTKQVRQSYEEVLANVRVANTMAIIVTSGAVLDDMVTRMIQAVGPKMSVEQANDMMNIIKGDYFRVQDAGNAMDAFLRTGIPFTQNRRLLADGNGRKIMSLHTATRGEGVAIIPSRIYEEVTKELAKFERQFDPLVKAAQNTLSARANQMWSRFMGELRQGMTTGLFLNAPHWVNTVWGDFWQIHETVGFDTAVRVTGANALVTSYRVASGLGSMTMRTIPGIGPKLEDYSIGLKKWVAQRKGLDPNDPEVIERILPSILETYLRSDIIRAWDHRFNGTFDLGDGFTLEADELRQMMAEDGVFDFALAQDQVALNQIIHLKNLERQYRQKLARAKRQGKSADEIEVIRQELLDVQNARATAEGPNIGRIMQQVRRVPGQQKVGELMDFSRDVARESMQHFQQRQRAALYIDMLRKTKSRDKSRQAVARALYDWNHGLTPFEMRTFSRHFLFYRFTRLNLTEGMRTLLGPFTEFEEGLNLGQVLTGQTRLSRTQDQLELMEQFRQEVMKAQGDPLASGEPASQQEWRASTLRGRGPDYFKFQHGFSAAADPHVQRHWYRGMGRKVDSTFARLPEMSTVQRYEAFTHVTNLLAYVVGSVPGDSLESNRTLSQNIKDPLEFIADQMLPGTAQIAESAINSMLGETSYNGSRPLPTGTEVMYRELLKAFGAEGYLEQINKDGRLGVPQFLHLLLTNIPYASSQGRRIAEMLGANPGRDYDEWSANAFKISLGLQPSPYFAAGQYDRKQRQAAKQLDEMVKKLERRPFKPRQMPYPFNLDD